MTKRCPRCKLVKDSAEFYRNRAQRDGLQAHCKPCFNVLSRESCKRNPARVRRNRRDYLARHPEALDKKNARQRLARATDAQRDAALDGYYRKHARSPLVYFVGPVDRSLGVVKIGSTDNLPVRLTMLSCGSPVPLEVYGTIPCPDRESMRKTEVEIHRNLKAQRSHGEWFRVTEDMALGIGMAA